MNRRQFLAETGKGALGLIACHYLSGCTPSYKPQGKGVHICKNT